MNNCICAERPAVLTVVDVNGSFLWFCPRCIFAFMTSVVWAAQGQPANLLELLNKIPLEKPNDGVVKVGCRHTFGVTKCPQCSLQN